MRLIQQLSKARELLSESLDAVIGRKKWDLSICEDACRIALIIHFPKIEITNSEGARHEILDLYTKSLIVINYIEDDGEGDDEVTIKLYGLDGYRTTQTAMEYHSNYMHSHLPRQRLRSTGWNQFCLGVGSGPMPSAINALSVDMEYDSLLFEVYLMQLQKYVAWESIEGGPYIPLTDLTEPSPDISVKAIAMRDTDKLVKLYLANKIDLPIDYHIVDNRTLTLRVNPYNPAFINLMDKYTSHKGFRSLSDNKFSWAADPFYKLKWYRRHISTLFRMPYRTRCRKSHVLFKGRRVWLRCIMPDPTSLIKEGLRTEGAEAYPRVVIRTAEKINKTLSKYCHENKETFKKEERKPEGNRDTYYRSTTNPTYTSNYEGC